MFLQLRKRLTLNRFCRLFLVIKSKLRQVACSFFFAYTPQTSAETNIPNNNIAQCRYRRRGITI